MDALPKLEDASNSNGRDFSNANASTPVSEEVFSKFFHDLINEDHLSSDSPIDLVGCCSHSQSNSYDVENVIPLPWLKMRSSDNTNHVSPSAQFQPAPSRSFSDTPNRPPLKKPALTAHETNKATLSSRQTIFTSLEEARQSVRRDNIQSDDTTLPSSPEEIRSCVTKLKKAFKSLHNATDSEGVKRSFKNSNYDERKVELLCWEILVNSSYSPSKCLFIN
ncbi:hypothetical protein N7478_012958 [Penicillium angulare]|uniref:uncharacterized protein n=1 Tax=Penicillium angulare TaxID=116970 RepID=UPI002540E330|nr:uncharacterized protein N7478_012958 [Penicillium angulare]KAJ5256854.1 hypothetical protein N7478_012958 [Penicillium angulare]